MVTIDETTDDLAFRYFQTLFHEVEHLRPELPRFGYAGYVIENQSTGTGMWRVIVIRARPMLDVPGLEGYFPTFEIKDSTVAEVLTRETANARALAKKFCSEWEWMLKMGAMK